MINFLTTDVDNALNQVPEFDFNQTVNSIKPAFHVKFIPGAHVLNFLSSFIKGFDVVGLLILAAGFIYISWSSLQGNGKWRRTGYVVVIATWALLVFDHFMIAGVLAYKSFYPHWKTAALIILTQVLLYALPTVLYYQGASSLEFYELSSDTTFLDKSQRQLEYSVGIQLLSIAVFVLIGIVLN